MNKNKFEKTTLTLKRMPLEMALHPFLTFFAGFVAAMAVAAVFLVTISNSIESDKPAAKNTEAQSQKFETKNCLDTFAEWDKQKNAAAAFLKNDLNNPFLTSPAAPAVDQTAE